MNFGKGIQFTKGYEWLGVAPGTSSISMSCQFDEAAKAITGNVSRDGVIGTIELKYHPRKEN